MLRTPLDAVIGFAQLLALDSLTPAQDEAVGHILFGGQHLLGMINDILDVARIESGRLELTVEVVDVSELVRETAGLMEQLAETNRISVSVTSDGTCSVIADRRRLKQALLNLVSNAIKYNRPQGRVELSTRTVGDGEVSIAITDSGLGIDAECLPRLFQPFDRLGRESTAIEGTGIGLALTKSLVTLMEGQLEVDSVAGLGSTFTITLPQAPDPGGPSKAEGRREHEVPIGETKEPRATLLQIGDNPPTGPDGRRGESASIV